MSKQTARAVAGVVAIASAVAVAVAVVDAPAPQRGLPLPGASNVETTPEPAHAGRVVDTVAPCTPLPPQSARPYRVAKDSSQREIVRGTWVDVASYQVRPERPTTHVLQVNLDVRHARGDRPEWVSVAWLVTRSPGPSARVGLHTFAVPARQGDRPFQITHRHTAVGATGSAVAQIRVEGSGSVTTRLTVAKSLVWWAKADATPSRSGDAAECGVDQVALGPAQGRDLAAERSLGEIAGVYHRAPVLRDRPPAAQLGQG